MSSHEEIYQDAVEMHPTASEDFPGSPVENGIVGEAVEFLPKSVEESRSTGTVPLSIYWKYFRSGSNHCTLFLLLLSSVVTQVLFTGSDYWLNIWTKAEEAKGVDLGPVPPGVPSYFEENSTSSNSSNSKFLEIYFIGWERENYIIIYSVIVGIFSIFSMARTLLFFKVCMDASVGLHNGSFQGIMRAPMRFFEVNPLGKKF